MICSSSARAASCFMAVKLTRGQWSKFVRHVSSIPTLRFRARASGQSGFTFSHSRVRLHMRFNGTIAQMDCAEPAHGCCLTVYAVFLTLISSALAPSGAPPARQRERGRRP
jgi:hypothetical protein